MYPVVDGGLAFIAIAFAVATLRGIAESRKVQNANLKLSSIDDLTGLSNRRQAVAKLEMVVAASARNRGMGAALVVGLDRFRAINESYGHNHGDLVIIAAAKRLKECVPKADAVARLSGDEFLVHLEKIEFQGEEHIQVRTFAEKVRACLQFPYEIEGRTHYGSASVGVAVYSDNKVTAADLLKQAYMAMYQAKELGRNNVIFFDKSVQEAEEGRSLMERELHCDIHAGKLLLHYQVQVDDQQRPTGAEALVRWNHDTMGLVSPGKFIPMAEGSHLIVELGTWVLETACKQLGAWANNDHTQHLSLSVNVSPRQFAQEDFLTIVSHQLAINDFPAERLKLEITEGVVIADVAEVAQKMVKLKRMGVQISMDDFGTGYSSLANLKRLPIDQVKIDQSFVRALGSDEGDALLIKAIISLAKDLKIGVIAEGVETEDQLVFLKTNGCRQFQGFYFGRPVRIDEFENLVISLQRHVSSKLVCR